MTTYEAQNLSKIDGVKSHTLSILGLSYMVRSFEGSWRQGCCLRPVFQKNILRNLSMHLESGQLTALLGNSGIYFKQFCIIFLSFSVRKVLMKKSIIHQKGWLNRIDI